MNIPAQPDVQTGTPPIHADAPSGTPASDPQHLRGSMRTHVVLLRFCTISFVTTIIDNVIFYLVFHATGTILGAQLAARAVSVVFNYRFVRQTVFFSDKGHDTLLPRYLALVALNALLAYAGIRLLTAYTPLSVIVSKIVAETLLFVVNFVVQRAFIFTRCAIAVPPPDSSARL